MSGPVDRRLRVGTTGDYPPLTYYDALTGRFSGQDIDLIEAFARDLSYRIEYVRTRWASLLDDLVAGRFEVAVGGISKTDRRAERALLSKPLAITGKVALVRRGKGAKYRSLETIDSPETAVVEDGGGTNEQFARANIKHARLIVLPDNKTPFDYLLDGRADVMFTDSTEALYRERTMSGLCAVRPEAPYTEVEKVFLFHRDLAALRDEFDEWLAMHRPPP